MLNTVELSDDRMHMTIRSPDGQRTAEMRSALPTGFTDEIAFKALTFDFSISVNERTVARRHHIAGPWYLYSVVSMGPPTWWWPRLRPGKTIKVGWLRLLIEVGIRKNVD